MDHTEARRLSPSSGPAEVSAYQEGSTYSSMKRFQLIFGSSGMTACFPYAFESVVMLQKTPAQAIA